MKATDHPIVGRRVLNVWRQQDGDSHQGTVTAVERGCNPLIYVRFDGRDFDVGLPCLDLAYVERWPRQGCRINEEELQ